MPVGLDFETKYRARLEEIEERESTVIGSRNPTYLAYKFSLHTLDNVPIFDEMGDVYLQWMTANTNTGYSKVPYIGSREIAEALVGKKLSTDEVRAHADDWDNWLIGKTALVDLMQVTDEKTGAERIRVIRITPDRSAPKAAAAASNGEDKAALLARLKAQMEALEGAN